MTADLAQLRALRKQLQKATGPDRALDKQLTECLPRAAKYRGKLLSSHAHVMAFTRSFEQADRFVEICLANWDITVMTDRKKMCYTTTAWSPNDHSDYEGNGKTAALSIIDAALCVAIAEGGWLIAEMEAVDA